jgi:hypothetical protein
MDEEHGYGIPAANIGDTDLIALARTNPEAAKEIARLEDLMNRGEETNEEFLRLCQLLFDVGSVAAAEILLRRNLDFYEGGVLYARLFGPAKQDEYEAAIEAFRSQFNLEMVLVAHDSFLVSTFRTDGGRPRSDAFALLSHACEIRFGYVEPEKVEADVILLDPGRSVFHADECLLMSFVNGVWEIADPLGPEA